MDNFNSKECPRSDKQLIEYILDCASELRKREGTKHTIWEVKDDENIKRITVLFNELSEMFNGTGISVKYNGMITDRYDASVVLEGENIEFSDIPKFLYLASIADCMEIDAIRNNKTRISFYITDFAENTVGAWNGGIG